MSEAAKQSMELMVTELVLFLVLMVIIYVVISITVHKIKPFSKLRKKNKAVLIKLVSAVAFCGLGYFFTTISANI